MSARIFVINGPPGAGKTSLATQLMKRFERGIHIPVDDLREWVVSGISHPIDWTDETTRQFLLAEEGAARLAALYAAAGFAVAIDHCAPLDRIERMADSFLSDFSVTKILLLPSLETNLERNALRKEKSFDPAVLVPTITGLNPQLRAASLGRADWLTLDSGTMSLACLADLALGGRR